MKVNKIQRKILIAVDFGTTFSAVCWAQTARSDRQYLIKTWPDEQGELDGRTENEVPTILVYDGDGSGPRWGYEIKENEPRNERFKLGLFPKGCREESYLNLIYPDALRKAPELTQKATDLTRDYLRKLHYHVIVTLKSALGDAVVDTTPIEYSLTVPAIWDDKAKDDTRLCALKAGFGHNIHMISEPEAAVTYALDAMDPGTLAVGDTFVLVDGGGGTGDLISYTVEELGDHVKVREAAPGTGALCGSSYLNQIFRDFLIDRFADDPDWEEDILDEAIQRFELWTKRQFRGEEGEFIIPASGLKVNPALGVTRRGKLRLTTKELIKIFEPVITVMTTLIQNQINATPGRVKAVLLVGGLGQSPYLKRVVQKIVGSDTMVLQPAEGDVAVVKGALVRGLALRSDTLSRVLVSSRVARKSFGTRVAVVYDPCIHDATDRYWDVVDKCWRVKVMEWFIKKGDILREDKAIESLYHRNKLQSDGTFEQCDSVIQVYDSINAEAPPLKQCAPGIRDHVVLTADTSTIPASSLQKVIGDDNKHYYRIYFEIRINFFSAHTEYSLWSAGKCYGKVEAKYE